MSDSRGWLCHGVAWCAIACVLPAARAEEPPPERAAADEVGRLLRAGMQVLRAAVPDGNEAAEAAIMLEEAQQAARAPRPDPQARAAAVEAAKKQQQQQIAQQAQQMQQFFQPTLQAELELARKTCGSLPVEARKKAVAAGNGAVKSIAMQFAERQMTGKGGQDFDPRATLHGVVAEAVKPHVSAEEFTAYEGEHAARTARRARAARLLIVSKLDRQLELSAAQRQAIEADLERHWQAEWLRDLGAGGVMINNYRPAPDFADACIAPHLDERQRAEWKAWCQQAGWNRLGRHMNWNFDGQSLQPDPWWSR